MQSSAQEVTMLSKLIAAAKDSWACFFLWCGMRKALSWVIERENLSKCLELYTRVKLRCDLLFCHFGSFERLLGNLLKYKMIVLHVPSIFR